MREKIEKRLAELKAERERVARSLEYYDVVIAELEKLLAESAGPAVLDKGGASREIEGT